MCPPWTTPPGTTGRLLELLSLLQGRPHWTGPELADRLGVTVRTVRRDVERLRRLGYPVLASIGVAGGYQLGSGGRSMPPLMLDRDEAVAVAVSLRSVAGDMVAGGGAGGDQRAWPSSTSCCRRRCAARSAPSTR